MVWEVIQSLEMYNIPVVSLTSDGAKPNRRFYRMCQTEKHGKKLPYKTFNRFCQGRELFFICDPPHLLKTARNCFSNSFAHSCSRTMQVNNHALDELAIMRMIMLYDRKMASKFHGSG